MQLSGNVGFFIDCQTGELQPLLTDAPSSCNNSQCGERHIEIALDNPGMFTRYIMLMGSRIFSLIFLIEVHCLS